MSTLNIPNVGLTSFTVISATAISYNDGGPKGAQIYEGVTDIQFPDGTHKTCASIIKDAGGASYSASELKVCVKVNAYDPDAANRQVFLVYSSNSKQTAKNSVAQVPGGVTVDVFDFTGTKDTNYIVKMWTDQGLASVFDPTWLGFKLNYGISESRSYVMTQVNDFGEESIPSPPTNIGVTIMHDSYLTGAFTAPAPIGTDLYVPIRSFKLYRAAITSNFNFVYQRAPITPVSIQYGLNYPIQWIDPLTQQPGVFPHSVYGAYPGNYVTQFGFSFTDNVLTQNLLESLPSLDWDAPPPRKLKGLVAWRNGMMAAYSDNQLYICEPYRPFTFPQKYIKALPWKILGLRVDENALIAVTEAEPYQFVGQHPSNVTYERLQGVQAALAPAVLPGGFVNPTRALVRTPHGVIYGTREGAVKVAGGRAEPLWHSLFTREEWVKRYGAYFGYMRMAYFDSYVLVYFDGVSIAGFYVNVDAETPRLIEWQAGGTQVADFVLPLTDSMYVVDYTAPVSTVSRFADERAARLPGTWLSRDVIVANPCNFGCLQVVGYGLVIATVFADGVAVATLNFTLPPSTINEITQRLPAGFHARRWSVQFQLDVNAVVSEAYLAGTRLELKRVP